MERRSPAIGVHVGLTYACVAAVRDGRVEVVPDEHGSRATPSVVAFTGYERLVGEPAESQRGCNPENTIYDVMRLIGRKFEDESIQRSISTWPFQVVAGPAGRVAVVADHRGQRIRFSPEEILAMILSKLRHIAEVFVGTQVRDAVVTVPGDFSESQRVATIDAAKIAGLNVLQLIAYPVAAAVSSFGLGRTPESDKSRKKHHLVLEYGSRELCIAVVSEQDEVLELKATTGDPDMGCGTFSTRMANFLAQRHLQTHGSNMATDAPSMRRLMAACEKATRELSDPDVSSVSVEYLHNGEYFSPTITRAKFEDLSRDIFDRCMGLVKLCIADSRTDKRAMDEVILVGKCTGIPKLQQLLKKFFHKEKLCISTKPDELVVRGAAIQAAKLTGVHGELLQDVAYKDALPVSIGIETWCGEMTVIVPRGTPIPVTKNLVIGVENQSSMNLRVFRGEEARTSGNKLLGVVEVDGIAATPERITRLNVDFSINVNGALGVTVYDERGARRMSRYFRK